jgi:hypothetical protein
MEHKSNPRSSVFNVQKRLEGTTVVQLTVELQGDQFAISSIAPKILEHPP